MGGAVDGTPALKGEFEAAVPNDDGVAVPKGEAIPVPNAGGAIVGVVNASLAIDRSLDA